MNLKLVTLWQRRWVKSSVILIWSVALFASVRIWYLEEQGNFHTISNGVAYRSAQLDRDELEYYVHKFNIRSIINLRGKEPGKSWYEEEIKTSHDLGVDHFDVGLSSDEVPPSDKIERLVELFRIVPKPVLIHCKAGADRSGLAAAIWKVVIDGESATIAKRQLSIFYGHLPIGPTQVMDRFFDSGYPFKNDKEKS